jgi:hypothetical protein
MLLNTACIIYTAPSKWYVNLSVFIVYFYPYISTYTLQSGLLQRIPTSFKMVQHECFCRPLLSLYTRCDQMRPSHGTELTNFEWNLEVKIVFHNAKHIYIYTKYSTKLTGLLNILKRAWWASFFNVNWKKIAPYCRKLLSVEFIDVCELNVPLFL